MSYVIQDESSDMQLSKEEEFIFPPEMEHSNEAKQLEDNDLEVSRTVVSASFEIAGVDIVLSVEMQGKERKFASILLEDFVLGYDNAAKPLTDVSVTLGGLSVEDLLHDGEAAFRYLLKSSNNEQKKKGGNLGVPNRLSSSCPETSLSFDCLALSTSLPSVLHNSPKRHYPSSPLRPMMHSYRKFPSQPQMLWSKDNASEGDNELEAQDDVTEESWVKINILLMDEEASMTDGDEMFVSVIKLKFCFHFMRSISVFDLKYLLHASEA